MNPRDIKTLNELMTRLKNQPNSQALSDKIHETINRLNEQAEKIQGESKKEYKAMLASFEGKLSQVEDQALFREDHSINSDEVDALINQTKKEMASAKEAPKSYARKRPDDGSEAERLMKMTLDWEKTLTGMDQLLDEMDGVKQSSTKTAKPPVKLATLEKRAEAKAEMLNKEISSFSKVTPEEKRNDPSKRDAALAQMNNLKNKIESKNSIIDFILKPIKAIKNLMNYFQKKAENLAIDNEMEEVTKARDMQTQAIADLKKSNDRIEKNIEKYSSKDDPRNNSLETKSHIAQWKKILEVNKTSIENLTKNEKELNKQLDTLIEKKAEIKARR